MISVRPTREQRERGRKGFERNTDSANVVPLAKAAPKKPRPYPRDDPRAMAALREKIIARLMREMNRTHAIIEYGSSVLMVSAFWNRKGLFDPRFRKHTEVRTLMANKQVLLPKITAKGRVSFERVNPVDIWLYDRRRRTLDELVNAPGVVVGPTKLNMWQGWGTKPTRLPDGSLDFSGDGCRMILDHIRDVWCQSVDLGLYRWILAWLADIVQNPCDKKGTGLMVYGPQGAGKSIIIEHVMSRILGSAYSLEKDTKFLTKDFNAKVGGKLLIFGDEAIFAGDPQVAARLKVFLTSETIDIRALYKDAVDVDNHARMFAAANPSTVSNHVLPLEKDDRRWTVTQASDIHVADMEYFAALRHEIENGGAEAFHAFLLNPKLFDGVNLRLPYETPAQLTQKISSLTSPQAFIHECLRTKFLYTPSSFGDPAPWGENTQVVKGDLHRAYLAWHKDTSRPRTPVLEGQFAELLKEIFGVALTDGRSGSKPRHWNLPPIEEARSMFAAWIKAPNTADGLARLWSDDPAQPTSYGTEDLPLDSPALTIEEFSRRADEECPF